jgi:hypothetical protein
MLTTYAERPADIPATLRFARSTSPAALKRGLTVPKTS